MKQLSFNIWQAIFKIKRDVADISVQVFSLNQYYPLVKLGYF